MTIPSIIKPIATVLVIHLILPASAETLESNTGWQNEVAIGIESEPTYAGSDNNKTEADFDFKAVHTNENGHQWLLSLGEIGYTRKVSEDTSITALLEYEEGREAEEEDLLKGLESVDDTVELQLSTTRRFGNSYGYAVLQYDLLDRGKGLVWFLGAAHDYELSDRLGVRLGLDISGADAEHMNTEFGISAAEASATGFSQYKPSSGLKSVTLSAESTYELNRNWSLLGEVEVENYLSEAADSPLIADYGSDVTYEVGIALRYQF